MRMMGAESVAYHRETVLGRADDHPGAALGLLRQPGETPLRWGGAGAERFGLVGTVEDEAYAGDLRAGRRGRPGVRCPAGGDEAAGHGADRGRPQVRRPARV